MKKMIVFFIIIFASSVFANSVEIVTPFKNILEVTSTPKGNLAFAGNNSSEPNLNHKKADSRCGYRIDGTFYQFKKEKFDIGINPVLVEDGDRTFLVCMSVNLDFSRGSLDIAVFNHNKKSLSRWTNIIDVTNGIADKPSVTMTSSGVLAVSFIYLEKPSSTSDYRSYLRIKYSSDSGKSWHESNLPRFKVRNSSDLVGEQGNFTWSENKNIFTSFARYDTNDIFVVQSHDSGKSFSILSQSKHNIKNEEVIPPVTKTVISERGRVEGILLHYAHYFKPVIFFPLKDGKLSKGIKLLDAATLAEARLLRGEMFLLSTNGTRGRGKTLITNFSSDFRMQSDYVVSNNTSFNSEFHYLGAYQSLTFEKGKLVSYFIDYQPKYQKLYKKEIE